MTEAVLLKLMDAALLAASVGLQREVILGKVTELQAKGATPEQIAQALVDMRNQAIADAEARIAGA